MPQKPQNLNIFLINQSKIDKSYSIKTLKELLSKIRSNELEEAQKLDDNQKTQIIKSILSRIDFLQTYYSKSKWKQQNKIITITYAEEELKIIQEKQNLIKNYTGKTKTIAQTIKLLSLQDTLSKDQLIQKQQEQERIENLTNLTRKLLRNLSGMATNFNQIIHNYHQRGIFNKTYSLTQEERNYALDLIKQLKTFLLKLTDYEKTLNHKTKEKDINHINLKTNSNETTKDNE